MDDPIISPWIIYAIDVCNSISEVSIIFSILGIFVIICIFIAMLDRPYEDNSRYKKLLKRLMISTIMFIIVAIIVPDKRVGYTMLATQYITEENVQQAAKMVDRIADKIIRVKNNS